MSTEYFICAVCSKRWGDLIPGAEMTITRCDEHKLAKSTAEIYAKGFSVGTFYRIPANAENKPVSSGSRNCTGAKSG